MKLNNNNVKIKNNNSDSNTVEEKELYMMLYHHRIFLLMCEYLIYIVASEGNASKNEVEILTKLNKQIMNSAYDYPLNLSLLPNSMRNRIEKKGQLSHSKK
jgi:hypothetical protein